jgi:molybdopterin-guanine dinucleotide biosynthesis protein B
VVAVVNDEAVATEIDLPTRPDLRPGLGPLGGVETALSWAREEGAAGALVLACDMPWVTRAVIDGILDAWTGDAPVAVRSDGPWGFEPLCAAVPTTLLDDASRVVSLGALEVGAWMKEAAPRFLSLPEPAGRVFRSVNRPRDLPPPTVAVIGNKKSGKTTLTVALIAALAERGRRVMSAKHGHHFRFDTEGTDSWRHRHEGGAERVVMMGPDELAVTGGWGDGGEPDLETAVAEYLHEAEVVVAEGFRRCPVPSIEIYRSRAQPEPITDPANAADAGLLAVVTDRPDLPWSVPVFDPDQADLANRLADLVEGALLGVVHAR